MRLVLLATAFTLVFLGTAQAQAPSRFGFGPVLRFDRVFLEGNAGGQATVAGIAVSCALTKALALEGELTGAWNAIEHSYEGWFISYAGADATLEEIERLAPTVRRTLRYEPSAGGGAALVFRAAQNARVGLRLIGGYSVRRYVETSGITIVTIPPGISPSRVATDLSGMTYARHRLRGGLLLGVTVPVTLSGRLAVAPEVRFVWDGPARVGNKYRELGFGVRSSWRF